MKKEFPTLHAISSKGKIKAWSVMAFGNEDGTATIRKRHGYLGQKIQEQDKIIKTGKNLGKANETTPFEQACLEAQSAWNKKQDKKYTVTIPDENTTSDILLPMLALPFKKRKHDIKYPALVQPKMNGVRCLATNVDGKDVKYTSRGGKSWDFFGHLTPHILRITRPGDTLDGEIYMHGVSFQAITRLVRKPKPETKDLQLWVYDIITPEDWDNEDRNKWIGSITNDNSFPIVRVPTTYVYNEEEVLESHDAFVDNGFEGAIVRNLDGKYKVDYRSKDLQKVKVPKDGEVTIVSAKEGTGRHAGCIVFLCETDKGVPVTVNPSWTLPRRKMAWINKEDYYGKRLTIEYEELSEDGVPLKPIGIEVRDYE